MLNIKSKGNTLLIGFLVLILLTAYCAPIEADIIPIQGLERAEMILYGEVSDTAILQKIDTLEMALFGQKTKGAITTRAQQIIDYVSSNDSDISMLLLLNLMDWTLFNEIKTGSLIERIETLEMNVFGSTGEGALITRLEKLSSLLVPMDTLTVGNVLAPQGSVIYINIQEEINTADIENGTLIDFKIDNNIKVDGYLIVPAGMEGTLEVTEVKPAGNFGQDASLTIKINDIPAFDGTMIPLTLKLDDEENNSKEIAVGVSLLSTIIVSNPVGLVAGYFFKGKDIVIPVGTIIQTQLMDEVEVYSVKIQ